MKALITAGGRATRLRPITWTINKHLIPLANKSMLQYAIEKIAATGIREIGINVNVGETEIQRVIGDGSRWGVRITYIEQVGGPKGLAHILSVARSFLGDEPFLFYLGDNIILGDLRRYIDAFEKKNLDGLMALARVKDPQRFGVPEIVDGKVVRVLEKPANPPSDFAVSGIYVLKPLALQALDHIQPSARGEYELPDVYTWMIQNGGNIGYEEITGWWKDTGKPEDLLEGNALLLNELRPEDVRMEGSVAPGAIMQGKVCVGKGTTIGPRVLIRGPVSIGENCDIQDSYIGPFTSIGNGVNIHKTELEHSIVFDNATLRAGKRIVDSLIGKHALVCPASETFPLGHRLIVGDNAIVEL